MIRSKMAAKFLFLVFFLFTAILLFSQDHEHGSNPQTIRGEVWIELEPIYGPYIDEEYPLDMAAAGRRALEESALFFSAMIYGWSFYYEIGERARRMGENMELTQVASIPFGDPGLRVTDVEVRDFRVRMWADYHLNEAQQRRLAVWRTGNIRNAQAVGYYSMGGPEEMAGWLAVRKAALEDAARSAIREMLRGSERNRPKEAHGFISLASFPRFFIDSGRWAVSARFRVQLNEIVPFSAY
jgi:hypothetical protein